MYHWSRSKISLTNTLFDNPLTAHLRINPLIPHPKTYMIESPTYLPPVFICHVNNIKNISFSEWKPSLLAGNQSVSHGIIVETCSHVDLKDGTDISTRDMDSSTHNMDTSTHDTDINIHDTDIISSLFICWHRFHGHIKQTPNVPNKNTFPQQNTECH